MPPRDRFINVGVLSSETAGPGIGPSLQRLGDVLFRNRRLDQQQSQFEASLTQNQQQFEATSAIEKLAVEFKKNQPIAQAAAMSKFSSALLESQDPTRTTILPPNPKEVGLSLQGTSTIGQPGGSPQNPNILREEPQVPQPDPRVVTTPQAPLSNRQRLQKFDSMLNNFTLQEQALIRADKSFIDQRSALVDAILDERKQKQKTFKRPPATSQEVREQLKIQEESGFGDPNNPAHVSLARENVDARKALQAGSIAAQQEFERGVVEKQINKDKPIPPNQLDGLIDPNTGKSFNKVGATFRDAEIAGVVRLNPKEKDKLEGRKTLKDSIGVVRGLIEDIFIAEGFREKVLQAGGNIFAAYDINITPSTEARQLKQKIAQYRVFQSLLPSQMVRAMGEVGTLTDFDIQRAQAIFSKIFDTFGILSVSRSTALGAIDAFDKFVTEVQTRTEEDLNILLSKGARVIRVVKDLPIDMQSNSIQSQTFIRDWKGSGKNTRKIPIN